MTINEETPQEELEQKISDAELKAQEGDSVEAEEISSSFEATPEDVSEESILEKQSLSKARIIWRQILVWLVVIAIAFAGGFFLDTKLRYQPEQDRTADLRADLDQAQSEIDSLEDEVEHLGTFKDQNTALSADIDQLNIHLVLLSIRVSVADAALALEQGRQADAKLALNKVGSTLESLNDLLNVEQSEIVDNMIQRYQLVMIELENDGATVQTDLELLSSKLLTLENTLFALP
jgi:flagellin-specific chaperone FliS